MRKHQHILLKIKIPPKIVKCGGMSPSYFLVGFPSYQLMVLNVFVKRPISFGHLYRVFCLEICIICFVWKFVSFASFFLFILFIHFGPLGSVEGLPHRNLSMLLEIGMIWEFVKINTV